MKDMQSVLDFPLPIGRKLLSSAPVPSSSGCISYVNEATLDPDRLVIITVLALLCLCILGIGLSSLFRCLFHCRMRIVVESSDGVANPGLRKAAMNALPIIIYSNKSNPGPVPTDCPICLAEFVEGEKMRILPNCNHGFHVECIDKWFVSHSSCPMCRQCLNMNGPNKKPGGAVIAQATESHIMHIVVLGATYSSHAVAVVSPDAETFKRTVEEAAVATTPQFPNPL